MKKISGCKRGHSISQYEMDHVTRGMIVACDAILRTTTKTLRSTTIYEIIWPTSAGAGQCTARVKWHKDPCGKWYVASGDVVGVFIRKLRRLTQDEIDEINIYERMKFLGAMA